MWRPGVFVALSLLTGLVLAATVFRNDIAQATGLAQSVTVANTPANPVPVEGAVSARPLPPAAPWHAGGFVVSIGTGPGANLAGPTDTAIDVTSFSAAPDPGKSGVLNLVASSVPASATDCNGADPFEIVYALDDVAAPVVITFPTPLVVTAPPGQKVCLSTTVGGTGATTGGFMSVNASGYYGT